MLFLKNQSTELKTSPQMQIKDENEKFAKGTTLNNQYVLIIGR